MATIARMTTISSAAAMTTAAVGLSPKIVVRSEVTVRGSAEPSSLLRDSFLRSIVIWPLRSPLGVETEPLTLDGPDGEAGAWALGAAGLGDVWAMAPPTRPRVTSAMSRSTATLFMVLHLLPDHE